MKIQRLTRIKNYCIFKDFTWAPPLADFGTHNLIYGWNGSGKTTLSNLFQCFELHIPVSEGELSVQIDDRTISSTSFPSETSLPQVRVFNKAFIDDNVFSATGLKPIFFLGKDSIEKRNIIDELQRQIANITENIKVKLRAKDAATKNADQYAIANGVAIKELLSSSGTNAYNNYDKASYRKKVTELTALPDLSSKILSLEEKDKCKKQKESIAKPELSQISFSFSDFKAIQEQAQHILQKTVSSEVIESLKNDPELSQWVKNGLELHKKTDKNKCLFCGNVLPANVINKYEGHFNDSFNRFITEIDLLIGELDSELFKLSCIELPDPAKFYDHLAVDVVKESQKIDDDIQKINKYLLRLKEVITEKKNHLFQPLPISPEIPPERDNIFKLLNAVITKHNEETHNHYVIVFNARKKLEDSLVAESISSYKKKTGEIGRLVSEIAEMNHEIGKIDLNIKQLEKEIIEHRRPADELNEDLKNYLGRSELEFAIREGDPGYQITRNGRNAKGLSEGEKTAIAFLYFLKSLFDKDFDIKKGIVVIDDPVSSLDSNSLFCAFGFMKDRVKDAAQLFILTHSFAFFRQVKNWFHHLPKKKSDTRYYMIETNCIEPERCAKLSPLDYLLHQYESEYHYLFKLVYTCANATSPTKSIEQYYHMPNVARRLLEAFLAFKHPRSASGELYKMLKNVEFNDAKKSRIIRFLHTHSHNGHIDDPEHDISILSETPEILKDVLKLINDSDKGHHDELVELVTAVPEEVHAS